MRYLITIALVLSAIFSQAQTRKADSLARLEVVTYYRTILLDSIQREQSRPKKKGPWKYDRLKREWVDSTKRRVS